MSGITTNKPNEPVCRLIDYLTEKQGKTQQEAEKMAQKVQDFIEPRLSEMQDEPKFYFSSENRNHLPRTVHFLPDNNLTLICFNKKRVEPDKKDKKLGNGAFKHVHEAFDYHTGKVYARVVGFSEIEKQCAELLMDVPGVVKTHCTYQYKSAKTGSEKVVAIQEKIEGSELLHVKLTPEQKCPAIRTLLKTLVEIHAKGITHGDLHCRNIRFDQDLQPKILDFGNATIHSKDVDQCWQRGKDMAYMAGNINFLCHGIMNTEHGKAFIYKMGRNGMSAAESLKAFDELSETPGFLDSIQEPIPATTDLKNVFYYS